MGACNPRLGMLLNLLQASKSNKHSILSSERLKLDSRVYVIEIFFNLNSNGMKNLNFSPKGPTTFKIFEMKLCLSLITKIHI